jgi:adenylate cyclase
MQAQDKPRQVGPASRQAESRHLRLLVLALATLVAISLLSRLPAWSLLELRSFDYLSTIRARHPADP